MCLELGRKAGELVMVWRVWVGGGGGGGGEGGSSISGREESGEDCGRGVCGRLVSHCLQVLMLG